MVEFHYFREEEEEGLIVYNKIATWAGYERGETGFVLLITIEFHPFTNQPTNQPTKLPTHQPSNPSSHLSSKHFLC